MVEQQARALFKRRKSIKIAKRIRDGAIGKLLEFDRLEPKQPDYVLTRKEIESLRENW